MALRNQPYLPLYVQDFLTDEKLIECTAAATGVYIRIMCIMHKSDPYGTILLKQKDKQSSNQILNFANKLSRQLPYSTKEIEDALIELIEQNVLLICNDELIQKRMKNDGIISEKRSSAGKKGAKKKNDFAKAKSIAKSIANSENENENENENEIDDIYTYIELIFSRTLSPIEYEIINKWLIDYDIHVIKFAIKETALNRVSNLKYTDKILQTYKNKSLEEITEAKNFKQKDNSNNILSKCENLQLKGEISNEL